MSTYQEFSQQVKQIFLNVIKFIEKVKLGSVIAFFNVNERLSSMFDISMGSVERLRSATRKIEYEMMERKRKIDEEKQDTGNQEVQMFHRLRNLRSSSPSSSSTTSIITMVANLSVPSPYSDQRR
jgi:hypothetical protein